MTIEQIIARLDVIERMADDEAADDTADAVARLRLDIEIDELRAADKAAVAAGARTAA